jgi:ribonuclease H / adenosylcobalamin/alpha-ribazole phosphatase
LKPRGPSYGSGGGRGGTSPGSSRPSDVRAGEGAAVPAPAARGDRPGAPRTVVIRADGAARGNPGPASSGAVLVDADRPGALEPAAPPVAVIARPLGIQTNNVAEYTAVILALRAARSLGVAEVRLVLDSNLVVEQLHGRWRVRDAKLRPLWAEARDLLAGFGRWSAVHEPRARNRAADALANLALDDPAAAAEAERTIGTHAAQAHAADADDAGPATLGLE